MEWNDDDLTCFTFCQISLSISLSSAPERTTEEEGREKGFFREEFRDLRTDRDSYLPPFLSLSLFSDPFFSLRSFTAFCKKKKVFLLLARICMCRRHQKRIRPIFGVIDI